MSTRIRASAPGKLFLIGEYAVLDGAPALLSAVNRRVEVMLEPAAGSHWSLTAPNLGLHAVDLGPLGRVNAMTDAATRTRLAVFDAVHRHVVDAVGAPLTARRVTIDSAAFAGTAGKLGLGSSAAVAAALTAALLSDAGIAFDRDTVADIAIAAHRRAQKGAGSGGDVACAVHGGLIRYTRGQPVIALDWPADLAAFAVATGAGANTPDLVARVHAYGEREPATYARDVGALAELAERAPAALADTDTFLALADDYFEGLRALDRHAGAGIVTARHEILHDVALRNGGVFKSSGAGGGDVGLAFARRGQPADRLAQALSAAGARVIDLSFAAPGVNVERIADSTSVKP